MRPKDALAPVITVLRDFFEQNADLLQIGINERSLTHKLAELLQFCFKRWSVDCEYNRLGVGLKVLPHPSQIDTADATGRTIFPDIIVHKRCVKENLLVIEVKKLGNNEVEDDIRKLEGLTAPSGDYAYECGLHLIIDCDNKAIARADVYVGGHRSDELTRWFVEKTKSDGSKQKTSDHRDQEALSLLQGNAADFLNGGIELIFAKRAGRRQTKIAVVAIQTGLELLAKYRLVQARGLASVVKGSLPQGPLTELAQQGQFHTHGYRRTLFALADVEFLSVMDEAILDEIADLRNALIHFSANVAVKTLRITCAHLILKGLNRFAAGAWRDDGDFRDHTFILTKKNFTLLTNFEPYRAEAVDDALDSPDTEKVFRCWVCKNDSLSLRTLGTYFCHCCGLTVVSSAAKFSNCKKCKVHFGVVFDPLNPTKGKYHGVCLFCNTKQLVPV